MTHICVSKLTTIGSDNGLSPGRRQAIIRTNAGILLIGHIGTHFSEILVILFYPQCKLTPIGSDNGLSPGRRQAIIRTNAGILLIGHIGTNFSEILVILFYPQCVKSRQCDLITRSSYEEQKN